MDDAEFNAEHQVSHKAEDQAREELGGLYDVINSAEGEPSVWPYPNEGDDDKWEWDVRLMTFVPTEKETRNG